MNESFGIGLGSERTLLDTDVLFGFPPQVVVFNMLLALILGMLLSSVYRRTHAGLSYSQSFTLTIVFVTVIVAIVIMVVGSNIARAFALVGAMSIIRFRTVVKDSKDTAYVFAGLAVGLAAGTANYVIAVLGALFISAMAVVFFKTNYGAMRQGDYLVRFRAGRTDQQQPYLDTLEKLASRANLLQASPTADGAALRLVYDVSLRNDADASQLAHALGQLEGVSEIAVISARGSVEDS